MILPDIAVWLALAHEAHPNHLSASRWIEKIDSSGELRFCRVTQLGLLRMLTQPAALKEDALTQREAWRVYERFLEDPRITYAVEPDSLEIHFKALSERDEISPKRWTDDYLAAFSIGANLQLVTFDRALASRVPNATLLTP